MIHFKISEFDFKGNDKFPFQKADGKMNLEFLDMLDKAREIAGVPFFISSGWRPEMYDFLTTGIRNSDHSQGCGADIFVNFSSGYTSFKILKALFAVGFTRIGINYKNNHIHVGAKATKGLPQAVFFIEY